MITKKAKNTFKNHLCIKNPYKMLQITINITAHQDKQFQHQSTPYQIPKQTMPNQKIRTAKREQTKQ
jgi:hypothetical protein